jgi:hypothetical protein
MSGVSAPASDASDRSGKTFGSALFRKALPLLPHNTLHGTQPNRPYGCFQTLTLDP